MSKPKNISENAQLLRGIGSGSWFEINKEGDDFRIKKIFRGRRVRMF